MAFKLDFVFTATLNQVTSYIKAPIEEVPKSVASMALIKPVLFGYCYDVLLTNSGDVLC